MSRPLVFVLRPTGEPLWLEEAEASSLPFKIANRQRLTAKEYDCDRLQEILAGRRTREATGKGRLL